MKNPWFVLPAAVLTLGYAGCNSLAPPNWPHPGPAAYQQRLAEHFDPYPENEPAPAIIGGRPLEYEKPQAEVVRARLQPWQAQW